MCDYFGQKPPADHKCGECEQSIECVNAWATGPRLTGDAPLRPRVLQNIIDQEFPEPDPEALEFRRMVRAGMDERDAAAEIDAGYLSEKDWLAMYA